MKKVILIIVLIVLIAIGIGSYFLFGSYSSGERAGTIIKLSEKGYVFKTFEGELNMGLVISDHGAANAAGQNIWTFTVKSKEKDVLKILTDAMLTGKRVRVHYNERYYKFPWEGDTKYFIDQVEVLKQ